MHVEKIIQIIPDNYVDSKLKNGQMLNDDYD